MTELLFKRCITMTTFFHDWSKPAMLNILSVHLYKKGERKPTTICLNVVRYHNVTRDNLLSS